MPGRANAMRPASTTTPRYPTRAMAWRRSRRAGGCAGLREAAPVELDQREDGRVEGAPGQLGDAQGAGEHRHQLGRRVVENAVPVEAGYRRARSMAAEHRLQAIDLVVGHVGQLARPRRPRVHHRDVDERAHAAAGVARAVQPGPPQECGRETAARSQQHARGPAHSERPAPGDAATTGRVAVRRVPGRPRLGHRVRPRHPAPPVSWTSRRRTSSMSWRHTPARSISFASQMLQRTHSRKSMRAPSMAPVGHACSHTLQCSQWTTRRMRTGETVEATASAAPNGQA